MGKTFKTVSSSFKMVSLLANVKPRPTYMLEAGLRPFHFLRNTSKVIGQKANNLCVPVSNQTCSCGCNGLHTKGDKELVEFLNEEITSESKAQKFPKLPNLEGFELTTEGADICLTKAFNSEKIRLKVNVNHTVDAEVSEGEVTPNQDNVDTGEMKSKPNFIVEITKGGKVIEFGCSIVDDGCINHPDDPEAYNDVFNIDELIIYEGARKDNTYAVSGEIMDGYLYDLLMNMLDERGISNEFVQKLVDFCTSYEHKLYIGFLEKIKSFVSEK